MNDQDTPAVRLVNATKKYGAFTALDHVSLEIRRGEVFALLGPNGAGKTTLIQLVAGTSRPTEGTVEVLGHDVTKDFQETRRAVGLVPQEINFDPFFTVEEALRFQAGYFGVTLTDERLVEILTALGLADKQKANSRQLSGGMKRRLLIAKALVHRPPVLFLDEPTAGVDVELRRDLWTYVSRLRDEGTTVVLTTHYLEEAEQLADRIGVIKGGKLLLVEDKKSLLRRYGRRSVKLFLEEKATSLPAAVARAGGVLEDDGKVVHLHPAPGEPISFELQALANAGAQVKDFEAKEPRLEDVMLELLHAQSPARESGVEPRASSAGDAHAQAVAESIQKNAPIAPTRAPPVREAIDPTRGWRTLYRKEVSRFLRVPGQTILSPLITTALYFAVFGFSLGSRMKEIDGIPYSHFLVPGLVMLGLINNAFLNTSSSLFIMKLQGTIIDLLVTPLGNWEIIAAFLLSACTRALSVGLLTWITAGFFTSFAVPHPFLAIFAALLVSLSFSAAGLIVAIWADKFEQVNFIPTFVITPLTFLGGVFYTGSMLPPMLHKVLLVNPIYYMIESMRFALLGQSSTPPLIGFALLSMMTASVITAAYLLLRSGYKLRG
jgi:ABC-2 type transport system ATP-binding protein